MNTNHSPLPQLHVDPTGDGNGFWTIRPFDGSEVGNCDVDPIATVYADEQSDEIVKRCNAYPALVGALDGLIDWAECQGNGAEELPIFTEARAALALARGEKGETK